MNKGIEDQKGNAKKLNLKRRWAIAVITMLLAGGVYVIGFSQFPKTIGLFCLALAPFLSSLALLSLAPRRLWYLTFICFFFLRVIIDLITYGFTVLLVTAPAGVTPIFGHEHTALLSVSIFVFCYLMMAIPQAFYAYYVGVCITGVKREQARGVFLLLYIVVVPFYAVLAYSSSSLINAISYFLVTTMPTLLAIRIMQKRATKEIQGDTFPMNKTA